MAMASARKNVPVTPVIEINGRNTTIGVSVEPISGTVSSREGAVHRFQAAFAAVAVQHDVLNDHDGVVDHQSAGSRKAAERHHVEALAQHLHGDERHENRHGNHQAGHQRGANVAQEQPDDEPGEQQDR